MTKSTMGTLAACLLTAGALTVGSLTACGAKEEPQPLPADSAPAAGPGGLPRDYHGELRTVVVMVEGKPVTCVYYDGSQVALSCAFQGVKL